MRTCVENTHTYAAGREAGRGVYYDVIHYRKVSQREFKLKVGMIN